jgi:hypothetical protein
MRRLFLAACLSLVIAGAIGPTAAAAPPVPPPIRVSIKSIMARARSQAPETIIVGLDCEPEKLFEGRLEIKWYLGKRLVHDYLSQEMIVSSVAQRLRITLPPIVVYSEKTPVVAYPRFHTKNEVIELKEQDLVIPTVMKRALVVANVQPHELLRPQWGRGIAEALGLEQFNPLPDPQFNMLTYPPRMDPEELPLVSAGYASFDLMLLEGEGFQKLRGVQLAAIGNWIAAGGSVVVVPQGILTAGHVEFLNRLAGAVESEGGASSPLYALNERGELLIGDAVLAAGRKLARYYAGLGRAVVVHGALDPQLDFDTREWKATVAFLWKLRAAQVDAISRTGYWTFAPPPAPGYMHTPRTFAPQPGEAAKSLKQLLMPERVEGVPLKVVVVILSLFLLAIAPGDYFLLGRFNCRKYTWWLFAAVSASFTICTVVVAEHYMGRADYGTSLTLVDLEDASRDTSPLPAVARTSRFNLVFVATQRVVETAVRNSLYVDLTEAERQDQRRHLRYPDETDTDQDLLDPDPDDLPAFEGPMPGSYTVRQQLRQWSPRLTRQTSLEGDQTLLPSAKIPWQTFRPREWGSGESRMALFQEIRAAEPGAHATLLNGQARYDSFEMPQAPPVAAVAQQLSLRRPSGLFAIVSQISPTGGENLEDLALFDETDPDQWLLLVSVRRDNNWVVYRKLYRASAAEGR